MDWIVNIVIALLSGGLGGLLATQYSHFLSTKRWHNNLRYELYKEVCEFISLYETELISDSVQDNPENITMVSSGIRLTHSTRFHLYSILWRIDDIFENSAKDLKGFFATNLFEDTRKYLYLRQQALREMAKEIKLPQKGKPLEMTPEIAEKFRKRESKEKNQS